MSLSYRSLLLVGTSDAAAIACEVLDDHGMSYLENTQEGIGSLFTVQPEFPESSLMTVALIEPQQRGQ